MDTNKIREALERIAQDNTIYRGPLGHWNAADEWMARKDIAKAALAELDKAQQPAEPVAWMAEDGRLASISAKANMPSSAHDAFIIPLFFAPAAGLTVEEAMEVLARYFFEVQQVAIGHKGSEIYDDLRARLTAAIQAKRTA